MQPNTDPIDRLKGTVTTIIQHATGSQAQVRHIQEWGIGALNKCYKVEVLAPGKTFFLKIENEDILPSTRRGQIEREVYSLRLMAQAGIPCPQMIDADCTRAVAGCKYMLEDFIDAQLFWEIKDELSSAEKEELKNAISQVLAGMQAITSPLFGDLYPGGAIGQYRSWPEAYIRMAILLLDDACQLAILQPPEQDMVEAALKRGAARLTADQPAGFYHGDLGLHNLLVSRADGLARLGQVIDFGNALYVPLYANEH
jgi:fructosamine-3-kinase